MATKFSPAPEVQAIAQSLIPLYHQHLVETRIEYVFCDKVSKKGGKEVWGTMRKVTNLTAYLGAEPDLKADGYNDPFFCMVISKPIWDDLGQEKRTALVDHELCHAWVETDDEGVAHLSILPHDLEEFTSIVKRYGLWREDVKRFVENAQNEEASNDLKSFLREKKHEPATNVA